MMSMRWDPCVDHRGPEAEAFLRTYFGQEDRRCCLIAGAGFDPRTMVVSRLLSETLGERLAGVFIREERPAPASALLEKAEANASQLATLIPKIEFVRVNVLAEDNAVVGGRNAVEAVRSRSFAGFTDVVVDLSALSIGTSFPIVRLILGKASQGPGKGFNVHVVVASLPEEDERRGRVSNDVTTVVHGFQGSLRLHSDSSSSRLWMPQLSIGKRDVLDRIFASQTFDDVCPIIPFPSRDARTADRLVESFIDHLENRWGVDARNFVYAAEEDPLDVYRSILRIDELRRAVFARVGSVVVLSPVGSKAVALGSLMAAIERDLPVVYVEALGYSLTASPTVVEREANLLHVWLHGEAYGSG